MEFLDVNNPITIDIANFWSHCKAIRAGGSRFRHGVMDKLDGIFVVGCKIDMGSSYSQPAGTKILGIFGVGDSAEDNMHIFHMVLCDSKGLNFEAEEVGILRRGRPEDQELWRDDGVRGGELNNLDMIYAVHKLNNLDKYIMKNHI